MRDWEAVNMIAVWSLGSPAFRLCLVGLVVKWLPYSFYNDWYFLVKKKREKNERLRDWEAVNMIAVWSLGNPPFRHCLVGLVVKMSAWRVEDPEFGSHFCRGDFSGSYHWLNDWHSSDYPARQLALQGQCWDCSDWCQYAVTEWGRKFDLQPLISVWQHINLFKQICPRDTLACCWDVEHPTNKPLLECCFLAAVTFHSWPLRNWVTLTAQSFFSLHHCEVRLLH